MKKTAKRVLLAAVAIMLCFVMAFAETPATTTDRVGNYFTTESGASNQSIECDAYVVGSDVKISNSAVGQSALLAGKDVNINNTTINGSLRAAGYSVAADATTVKLNATVAGYSVSLGNGFSAGAVYAAGNKV